MVADGFWGEITGRAFSGGGGIVCRTKFVARRMLCLQDGNSNSLERESCYHMLRHLVVATCGPGSLSCAH
jgi:hypothetical protein